MCVAPSPRPLQSDTVAQFCRVPSPAVTNTPPQGEAGLAGVL